ncbi:VCBS repeat-containing protein [Catalinimonas niigatensis]|uniref:VCBS repeat-containing protein n=1 Tax=Catalinimonas niigatensis TaxID=1397264 RepID=UPI00266660A9|nr:VCBS repeat-containing protein [Catalinimonas niigatensis]WPP50772.1 VCBS repeat-containing protein [Catalinimonas niigatensis]
MACALLLSACNSEQEYEKKRLFTLLSSSATGVDFTNTITESDSLNILRQANLYNGGGVGIGDFNNDGWVDVYFAGNMVSNKLYLNKGKAEKTLAFEDITDAAGVGGQGRWCTGISVVDINADGWLDIYVSASFLEDKNQRKNLMYMNQGLNEDGIPVFKEMAEAFGIADTGFSTQGVFFDYDKDGDLDLYVLTNELNDPKTPIQYRPKVADGSARNNDRLYRNEGNVTGGYPVFKDVSREAGILVEGWGHAVSVSDFNLDGWPDMYVSNDFVSNDLLYINNQDGTFTNRAPAYLKHTAWNAMGTDVVDVNNDGWADIMSLEMLPESNIRKKTMLGGNEYFNYFNNRKYDYEHQYVRNVLQLNSGMTPKGHPIFSEVAFMAGVYQTDWSWAPLIADFDNDGFRDMIITNGLPRDVTDLDYIVYDNGQDNYGGSVNATLKMVEEYFPVVKISNYGFRNNGGYTFADSTNEWGLNLPSFSNGGVYADLDNDGDLDLVVNNINDPAFIYENTLNNSEEHTDHYLSVVLKGNALNPGGHGATIRIYYEGKQQLYEHQPTRGYLSTVDARAHFGMGKATQIDSLRIQWPDGKEQLLTNIKTDQSITLSYQDAEEIKRSSPGYTAETPVFTAASDLKMSGLLISANQYGIQFKHQERDAIDYNIQRTLPHKMSQYGPGIAVGDVDHNGHEDFYVGGAAGHAGLFFMQDAKGNFTIDSTRISAKEEAEPEDMGALLFDADNDGDLDLYVVSGSYEFPPEHPVNQDRLYINNGRGRFQKSNTALPKLQGNGSCVRAADFDQDGDLDLFVGGRSVSGAYPLAPKSYILENQGGIFVDVSLQLYPPLEELGMITDALWTDFDQDGWVDLLVVGEWMPLTFLRNTGNLFENVSENSEISGHSGWWNSLASGDFDHDGDIDYVAGNLGLNSNYQASEEEPMTIFAKDVDDNGKIDPMVFCYMMAEDSTQKSFPMHTRDDMISQLVSIRKQYPTYKSYGRAGMGDLWPQALREGATTMQAYDLRSSYIENLGDGKFSIRPLPIEAQLAPVYGMLSKDLDQDGSLDLLLVGNDYGIEPISGRHDAFNGLTLIGDGKGNFKPLTIAESGFFVPGDAKGLAVVHSAQGKDLMIATQNQDSLMVFTPNGSQEKGQEWIDLQANDLFAEVVYEDNRRERLEFYHGNTFLSQSSRTIKVAHDAVSITITDFSGNKREIKPIN